MKSTKMFLFDGRKSVSPWDLDNNIGWTPLGGDNRTAVDDKFYQRVPWLHRAIKDRANNVGSMPFHVMRGETEVDSSQSYANKLTFMPSPVKLFKLIEMSLAVAGRAYLFLETNRSGYIKNLKYLVPSTIAEVYDKVTGEIIAFERMVNGRRIEIAPENIAAFYDTDYTAEIGPGKSSDALAALSAAGVLFNADTFIADYFERGAIKATILNADTADKNEMERLQNWWNDVIVGIKNAWSAVVMRAKTVTATVIGEGLESLSNTELTSERRQDIATAMGTPESRMWSAAANYATRVQDDKAYFEGTIIPECDIIAEVFNAQIFNAAHKMDGYKLVFDAESLDVFQVDAKEQAGALNQLITAGLPLLMAMDLLGFELTDEQRAELEKRQAEAEVMAAEKVKCESCGSEYLASLSSCPKCGAPKEGQQEEQEEPEERDEPPTASPDEMRSVLSAWKRKALHALKRGDAQPEFTTTVLPVKLAEYIRASLATATDEAAIKAVFDGIMLDAPIPEVVVVVDPLDRAAKLVERLEAALATK